MEMTGVRYIWLRSIAALVLFSGCAGTAERESSWPKLPSPWATVRRSPPRSAIDKSEAPGSLSEQRMPKDDGSQAMALLNGMNFERAGEWEKAREVYEQIRKKDPENAEAAHRLGIVADSQRRHAEAEQLFLFA